MLVRRAWSFAFACGLVGCETRAPLERSAASVSCAHEAEGSVVAASSLEERRFGLALRQVEQPNGHHHPERRFLLETSKRTFDVGVGRFAVLARDAVYVVRVDESLDRVAAANGCATRVATDALPDMTVDPSGDRLAFVRRNDDGTAIEIHDGHALRRVASTFAEADRPLFADARTLIFVGSATPGVSTFHRVVDLGAPAAVAPVGTPLPAWRKGYAIVSSELHWDDGERLRALDLATGVLRDRGPSKGAP